MDGCQVWDVGPRHRTVAPGALGDCWLLAAIACLAEHDGAIQAVFRTKEVNPRGKYVMRLYDGAKDRSFFEGKDEDDPYDPDQPWWFSYVFVGMALENSPFRSRDVLEAKYTICIHMLLLKAFEDRTHLTLPADVRFTAPQLRAQDQVKD